MSANPLSHPATEERLLEEEIAAVVAFEEQCVTEDETPVDNFFSAIEQRLLVDALHRRSTWNRGERPFVATANVAVYFQLHVPPLVPDALLSLDVNLPEDLWAKHGRCYFTWRMGKPPDVAVEIVSNDEGGEADHKLHTYARIGVPYYVIHDPQTILSAEALRAFSLIHGRYEPIAPEWLPAVGLGLKLWHGSYESREDTWLRWCDQNGQIIPTGGEYAEQEKQRAEQAERLIEQEKQRAEQAERWAEQEKQRAEQEKQRADQLAALLRAAGIEPPV